MKKILYSFLALALIAGASSCKKCGYCQYVDGSRSSAICKSNTASALGVDSYSSSEADCKATIGASWVIE